MGCIMLEENDFNLSEKVKNFIQKNPATEEILRHLHPSAETALCIEFVNVGYNVRKVIATAIGKRLSKYFPSSVLESCGIDKETKKFARHGPIYVAPIVGVVFGARRMWYMESKALEPLKTIYKLGELGILEKNFGDNCICPDKDGALSVEYFALRGEWDKDKKPTIYAQLCARPDLRSKFHEQIGSKLPALYLVDK